MAKHFTKQTILRISKILMFKEKTSVCHFTHIGGFVLIWKKVWYLTYIPEIYRRFTVLLVSGLGFQPDSHCLVCRLEKPRTHSCQWRMVNMQCFSSWERHDLPCESSWNMLLSHLEIFLAFWVLYWKPSWKPTNNAWKSTNKINGLH